MFLEIELRAGLAVRAVPLRPGCKVRVQKWERPIKNGPQVHLFVFFMKKRAFFCCIRRKTRARKNLSYECFFLLYQRNRSILGNKISDAWNSCCSDASLRQ
jgi:hypothetical protein